MLQAQPEENEHDCLFVDKMTKKGSVVCTLKLD